MAHRKFKVAIGVPDGTAAAPAFLLNNYTDAGIYNASGTSSLQFATAGTHAVTIDSTQQVGVGTDTPGTELEVAGTIWVESGSESAPSYSFAGDTDTGFFRDASNEPAIASSGTKVARWISGGQFQLRDGTAAAPIYSFLNDIDLGIYRVGTNTLGIAGNGGLQYARFGASDIRFWSSADLGASTNMAARTASDVVLAITGLSSQTGNMFEIWDNATTELLVVDSSGNVGINTASPDKIFHVQAGDLSATAHADTDFVFENTNNAILQLMAADFCGIYAGDAADLQIGRLLYYHSSNQWRIRAGGTDILNADSTGVGIGTTSPGHPLHVDDSGGSTASFAVTYDADQSNSFEVFAANSLHSAIRIRTNNASRNAGVDLRNETSATTWGIAHEYSTGSLVFGDTSTIATTFVNAAVMTLEQGGNVGIGTSSPTSTVHIVASSNASFSLQESGQEDYKWTAAGSLLKLEVNGDEAFRIEQDHDIAFFDDTGNGPYFFWDANNERLAIGDDTSPSTKLTVTHDGLAATQDDTKGIRLKNSTAATLGVSVQISPSLVFEGQAYDSGGFDSDPFEIQIYCKPEGDTGYGSLVFEKSVDSAAYTEMMRLYWDGTRPRLGLGTNSPDKSLHVEEDDSSTATVLYPFRMTRTSSGTPAANIGVGMEFEVETSASNNEIGATIEVHADDVTSASEDFSIVFKTMAAGAAAATRATLNSTGFGVGTEPSEDIHANDTVRADSRFNHNGTDGLTGSVSWQDGMGQQHDVSVNGGIITSWQLDSVEQLT